MELNSNFTSPMPESAWRTPHMTKQIPKKGDIVTLGKSKVIVTEARDGKVYSFKRLQTTFITFDLGDDIPARQQIIRNTMKDKLPIELVKVSLMVSGMEIEYGYEQDLHNAESMTIIYTK